MKEILLEKSRAELLQKSRNADVTKSYGTTRYDRKDHQHIYNTTQNFNRIDMNALFKANLLSFKVPIQGEHGNYEVEILFEGILDSIKQQIKTNQNICEFKCVYRALINAINANDIYVACTCPDFKYRMAYHATKGRYNAGAPQVVPAKMTNPNDSKGAGCKHVMKVIGDLSWAVKLATAINNYITYMQEHYEKKFAELMFPALYDMPYNKAVQLGLFDDDNDNELANTMDNDDTSEIDQANAEGEEPTEDELADLVEPDVEEEPLPDEEDEAGDLL